MLRKSSAIPTSTTEEPAISEKSKARVKSSGVWVGMFAALFWLLPISIRLAVGPKHGAQWAAVAVVVLALAIALLLGHQFRSDHKKRREWLANWRRGEDIRKQTFKCVSPQRIGLVVGFPIRIVNRDASVSRVLKLDDDAASVEITRTTNADGTYDASIALRALVSRIFELPYTTTVFYGGDSGGPTGVSVIVTREGYGPMLAQKVGATILDVIAIESGTASVGISAHAIKRS